MPTWETQGSHRIYRDEDLVLFEVHGMFDLADTQRMYVITEEVLHEYGYILSVFDARDAVGITAEGRRYVGVKAKAGHNAGAVTIIGASFPIRTVISLLRNAARLIGRPMPPMEFFSTQADAIRWLALQRPHFRTKRRQSS